MTRMTGPHLLDLSTEILLEIISYLENTPTSQSNLLNLSSVSSHFRSFLAPYVFASITLRNTEKSGASVDLIAKSNHRQYVRELSFVGTAPGDHEEGFLDVEGIFPQVVEDVLSDLGCFANLETVHIHFALDFANGWEKGFMLFQDYEDAQQRIELEQTEAWRALNTKVYAALARNVDPGFKHLALDYLIPAEPSSFSTIEFQNLLGRMKRFTLSCWSDDQGDFAAGTRRGYISYVRRYGSLLFDHLSSITHLSVSADYLPISIFETGVLKPHLKSLFIDSIFLTSGLKDLVSQHARKLESIHLQDCHSYSEFEYDPVNWAELCTALADAQPTKLREFAVTPTHGMELVEDDRIVNHEAARALEILRTDPKRRLFSYSYIDTMYGDVRDVQESNLDSFRRGDDQRAYDKLMRIVELNSSNYRTREP